MHMLARNCVVWPSSGYECFGVCVARTCVVCTFAWLAYGLTFYGLWWLSLCGQGLDMYFVGWVLNIFHTEGDIIGGEIGVLSLASHGGYISYCVILYYHGCCATWVIDENI